MQKGFTKQENKMEHKKIKRLIDELLNEKNLEVTKN